MMAPLHKLIWYNILVGYVKLERSDEVRNVANSNKHVNARSQMIATNYYVSMHEL